MTTITNSTVLNQNLNCLYADARNTGIAVENRIPIEFMYQGYTRQVCPYLLGRTADGRLVLHGLQFGGTTSKGPVGVASMQWRFFYLDQFDSSPTELPQSLWVQVELKKMETAYQPPKFIAEVLAITPKEQ